MKLIQHLIKRDMAKGKILAFLNRPLIKGLIKSIPFVGDVADNILDEQPGSPSGQVNRSDLTSKLIRMGILLGILYLVFSGKLSMEEAEGYKEFID